MKSPNEMSTQTTIKKINQEMNLKKKGMHPKWTWHWKINKTHIDQRKIPGEEMLRVIKQT